MSARAGKLPELPFLASRHLLNSFLIETLHKQMMQAAVFLPDLG